MDSEFSFEISLTILDHLGRNLYRSSSTVLGEAISNAWDADAKNVRITLDSRNSTLIIRDDGIGMTKNSFQKKFLRIGYTKRKDGVESPGGRPYIGRKGIGKLALLSCAESVSIATKTEKGKYVGGTIDNSDLDQVITSDLKPNKYRLKALDLSKFQKYTKNHNKGTIIMLEGFRGGIQNTEKHLRKQIALYFRFALIDPTFKIFLNGKRIAVSDIKDLFDKTEFLWVVGDARDPLILAMDAIKEEREKESFLGVTGFIASVEKPRQLSIMGSDERVSVDLFVNGRVRERNILRHIPTARLPESYLYGQIHYNSLEGDIDRFTSSREGVIADDPLYEAFLKQLRKLILEINEEWDDLRRKFREDGDTENTKNLSPKERKSEELVNIVSSDYELPKNAPGRKLVDQWVDDLRKDAMFNVATYAECFISENLVRQYTRYKGIALSEKYAKEVEKMRSKARNSVSAAGMTILIRSQDDDLSYLDMDSLSRIADKQGDPNKEPFLIRDATQYKPIRDACAHTSLLTQVAKDKLTSVYENIKGRLRQLLGDL